MRREAQEQNTKIIFLAQKLLSVHYSGIYLTGFDIASVAEKIGFDQSVGNREEMMVSLLNHGDEEGKLSELSTHFSHLIEERSREYATLLDHYPETQRAISSWIFKGKNVTNLFIQAQQRSPYES